MTPVVSVIIPACNEGRHIGACLKAVLNSDPLPKHSLEVVVVANGCTDDTVAVANRFHAMAEPRGWRLKVLELPKGSKVIALNAGDARAIGHIRVYLDADVIVSPGLLAELTETLNVSKARFATGTPSVDVPDNWVIAQYARFWQTLPYMRMGGPGFGIYAVNTNGRARWPKFPNVIADDTFVRLNFAPSERVQVDATYRWPMVDTLSRLVRVRRRQDRGTVQIAAEYPHLMQNENKPAPKFPALIKADPLGFVVYATISAIVRATRSSGGEEWARGR
jgi:glycosyltransferase involved in cell wall biosynthesis